MRGRKPTPTKVLEARGAFEKHPERAKARAAEPDGGPPVECPPHLAGDQRHAWDDIIAKAPRGVLTAADALAVEVAAVLLAQFRRAPEEMQGAKLVRLTALLGQFGMTPAERARLHVDDVRRQENRFAQNGMRPGGRRKKEID